MKTILKITLPILVLAAAAVVARMIVRAAPRPEPRPPERRLPPVLVVPVALETLRLDVTAHGLVKPRTEIALVPQVAGKVDHVSPALREGAFFEEGEVLLRIERRDYELHRARAEALVAQADARLSRERAEAALAREEWERFGRGEPGPLALRAPQLLEAEAALAAARAELEAADLSLARTELRAPFAGRVRSVDVERGQHVPAGAPMARIYATDHAEVRLAIPGGDAAFLDLPLATSLEPGEMEDGGPGAAPEVTLSTDFAGERLEWRGRIVRTEAELDARSRVLHAIARVEDPYGRRGGGGPPLLVGMHVTAVIRGRTRGGLAVLPAEALRAGNRVIVVDGEDRVRLRQVDVLRIEGERAVVSRGLSGGERVAVTRLDPAVEGMAVRVEEGVER